MVRPAKGKASLTLDDLPKYARETLGLHGLTLWTDLLAGCGRGDLDRLRERADKTGCACLVLIETDAHKLAAPNADQSVGRLSRVVEAASLLGCNSMGVRIEAPDTEQAFERVAERMRRVVQQAERRDINVLIAPQPGLTADAERVTELVKKIGGFRVGTLPDLADAAGTDDPVAYLRKLAPYAAAVNAGVFGFKTETVEAPPSSDDPLDALIDQLGEELGIEEDEEQGPREIVTHTTFDLDPLVTAVMAVGYDGTLAIDYRGEEDGTIGVLNARAALEDALTRAAEK